LATRAPGHGIWLLLWLIALGSRVAAALLLPNPEQDAYAYVETIARMSDDLSVHGFRLNILFNFWLPLYQLIAAVVTMAVGNPLLVGKLLSAICGAASCVLVFAVTRQLIGSVRLAWAGFGLLALNPLHLFYSGASMTDVPHACFVLASLFAALRSRWVLSALCIAVAAGLRIDAWSFILVLPAIQFAQERRVSRRGLAILLATPLSWLAICYAATGDPFRFFRERARYVADYLQFIPSRKSLAPEDSWRDLLYFAVGGNTVVLLFSLIVGGWLLWRAFRSVEGKLPRPTIVAVYFFTLLGFLLLAYITKAQPVIWARYGLIFFALGIPLFVWSLQIARQEASGWFSSVFIVSVLALCLAETRRQMPMIRQALEYHDAQKAVAVAARGLVLDAGAEATSFCDDAGVRVLSRLPPERFLVSRLVPPGEARDASAFVDYLREERAVCLVFAQQENSVPVKLLPGLAGTSPTAVPPFTPVAIRHAPFGPALQLYRLRMD
jgi:hypothetical protein